MKRKLLSIAMVVMVTLLPRIAVAQSDWGPADTVACHSMGPGMWYTKLIFHDKPLILWFVEIDLQNEYNKVEQAESRNAVPDVLRWDVPTFMKENTRDGHRVKIAWNHDFFSYDDGICIGVNISEGESTWHKWGRSLLAITADKTAEVFYPDFDCRVTAPDSTQVVIDYFNAFETGLSGDCILYNRFNSKQLTEAGKYILLTPLDAWIVNGDPIRCRVDQIADVPLQTSQQRYVLYLRNGKQTALDGHVAVGDELVVTQNFIPTGWGNPPANILNAFHGYPSIVHDGVLHQGEYNNFENGREYEISCRVMAGVSKDKKKLYIATTEMSSDSQGVDCIELSQWMVQHGAWDVVNFDSGGSVAIVVNDEMLNVPGRGSVRPVKDAMLAVALNPVDESVDHLSFSVPRISPSVISRVPLRVMAFNKYGEVLVDDLQGCEFMCEPETLGFVDSDAIFHSSTDAQSGRVIARKDGREAVLEVVTQPISGVAPVYSHLLIDDNRRHLMAVTGLNGSGATVDVDPGAFRWTPSVEGVAHVDESGILTGLTEGSTMFTASFGDVTFDMAVDVEIPQQPHLCHSRFDTIANMGLTASSVVKDLVVDNDKLPQGWNGGAALSFNLKTGRGATLKFYPQVRFYSLPDSVSFRVYDNNKAVSSAVLAFVDGLGQRFSRTVALMSVDSVYNVAFVDGGELLPVERYPVTLTTMTFSLNSKSADDCVLAFDYLDAYYPGYISGIDEVKQDALAEDLKLSSHISGETLTVKILSEASGHALVTLSAIDGKCLRKDHVSLSTPQTQHIMSVKELPVGIYLLSVKIGAKIFSEKIFIK